MRRHRTIILPLLLCLLASPVSAVLSPIGAAATPVTISASTATPHFPNTIAFHLDATATTGEITKIRLAYRPARYAVSTVLNVPFERGSHIALDYSSDMQVAWLPPGLDIEYRWLLSLSDGTLFTTDPLTFLYMDEQHPWKKTISGPVTLWWYNGDDAFGKDAVDTAIRTIDTLKKTYSFADAPPIRIVVYGSARAFHDVNAPNSPTWEGGFNSPRYGIIVVAPSGGVSIQMEIRRLIPHEVTHQMIYEASKNPYNTPPAWLDEGLAVHDQEFPDLFLRPALMDAVQKGQLIPLRALDAQFVYTSDIQQAYLGYAEAESVVNYIINAYGSKYIGALVSAFKDELSFDQVVQQVLKESIEDLDKEWRASLNYSGDQGGITG